MKNKINYLAILIFYTIAIALRYLTNKTQLSDYIPSDFLNIILRGIGPAVGAIAVILIFKKKPVLSLKGNYKNTLIPLFLYWILPVIFISGIGFITTTRTVSPELITTILIYGLLEEIGWRGFLQQELKTLPPFLNILIVATLWFTWHLNFDLTSSNLLFFGILILGSWGIGKVADSTHSLIAVSAFHSLNNFFPEVDTTKILIIVSLLLIWIISLVVRKKHLNKHITQ